MKEVSRVFIGAGMFRLLIIICAAASVFVFGSSHATAQEVKQSSGPPLEHSARLDAVLQQLNAVQSENQEFRRRLDSLLPSGREKESFEPIPFGTLIAFRHSTGWSGGGAGENDVAVEEGRRRERLVGHRTRSVKRHCAKGAQRV